VLLWTTPARAAEDAEVADEGCDDDDVERERPDDADEHDEEVDDEADCGRENGTPAAASTSSFSVAKALPLLPCVTTRSSAPDSFAPPLALPELRADSLAARLVAGERAAGCCFLPRTTRQATGTREKQSQPRRQRGGLSCSQRPQTPFLALLAREEQGAQKAEAAAHADSYR
jgi:hypothetical protein